MTNDEINKTIATHIFGFEDYDMLLSFSGAPERKLYGATKFANTWTPVPDYCNDLNAIHDVKSTLKGDKRIGFIHTPFVAFAVDTETDAITSTIENGEPKLAYTFLLGEEKEWDIKLHDVEGVKQRAIAQMKKLDIKWVYSVYCGEIYIPKNQIRGARYHHIFVRGAVKNV